MTEILRRRPALRGGRLVAVLAAFVMVAAGLSVVAAGPAQAAVKTARPGDGNYYCSGGRHGFGFTLDPPDDVRGGIQWIKVDLWKIRPPLGPVVLDDTHNYYRP